MTAALWRVPEQPYPIQASILALSDSLEDAAGRLDHRLSGSDAATADALRKIAAQVHRAIPKLARGDTVGAAETIAIAADRLAAIAAKLDEQPLAADAPSA